MQFDKSKSTSSKRLPICLPRSLELFSKKLCRESQLALSQSKLGLQADDMENRKLYFQDAHKNIQKAEHLAIKPNKRQQYRKTLLGIKNQLSR